MLDLLLDNLYLLDNRVYLPGALDALTELDLSSTSVAGTLPPQFSTLTTLATLALEKNQLTGTLPAQWSMMTALTQLKLGNNQFQASGARYVRCNRLALSSASM